mgnify:FL=1
MTYLFLLLALLLSVVIVYLLVSNIRASGELKAVLGQIAELERDNSLLTENLQTAKQGLSDAEQRMKSLRSELRAEIDGGASGGDRG